MTAPALLAWARVRILNRDPPTIDEWAAAQDAFLSPPPAPWPYDAPATYPAPVDHDHHH